QQFITRMNEENTLLLLQQSDITRTALNSLNMYHHIQSSSLNKEEWSSLIKMIEREVIPLLPEKMGQQLGKVLETLTIHDQKQLNHLLKGLASHQIYAQLADISKHTRQLMTENVLLSSFPLKDGSLSFILYVIILKY